MADDPVFLVETVAGSSASDDGDFVLIGFKLPNGETFNLALPHLRAIDLLVQTAMATSQAAKNRDHDPRSKYLFPVERYEVGTPNPDGTVFVNLGLPDGPELSFRFDLAGALRFHEGLGTALGVNIPTAPAGTRPN